MNRTTAASNVMKSAIRRHRSAGLRGLLAIALVLSVTLGTERSLAAPAATVWYVSPAGNDDNNCLSSQTACAHIQSALGQAGIGDTIVIAAGTYIENLSISDSVVTLQGADQATTIIDGQALGTTILIDNATVNLSGVTVRNGQSSYGAGLNIGPSAIVNISNSRIIQNVGSGGGAGIANQGSLKLVNVTLSNNTNNGNDRGGGLRNLGSAELINSVVNNNQSASDAGGIYNRGVLTITNSTLSGNKGAAGGALYNLSSLSLLNSTISRNQATSGAGGGIYNSGLGFSQGVVIDSGSIITGNVAATSGGGVHNTLSGKLTFNGTSILSNTASSTFGGGLYSDGTASLSGVSVKNNRAASGGGGLYSENISSTLTINQSQINNNQSAVNGGGLLNNGTASLSYVTLDNNQSAVNGGGLLNHGAASLSYVTLDNNQSAVSGGGIYNASGQLTLVQSELSGNFATTGNGGGLFNQATANLAQVVVQNNRSANGGGLNNDSTGYLLVANSTIYKNDSVLSPGGGINNHGTLMVIQSTLYSNTTTLQGGSGLYNTASAELTNVTLSYNTVLSATTGAILNDDGTLDILNSTISHNGWPALARTGGSIVLTNTIVAASAGGVNCSSTLTSNGHNLDSGNSCGFNATGDITATDPLLGPLTNNGGPTLTRALQIDSRAIDAGDNTTCPPLDQRGITRPQGDACDIGAYEIIGYTNNVTGTIAAGGCLTNTTVISSGYLIGSLHVGANITFAPRGDLRVKLYSPTDSQIQLLGATGGTGQNLNVLWDDNATQPVGTEDQTIALPYYQYVRLPDESLAPMSGRSLRGAWRLELCNLSSDVNNSATLNRWTLLVPSVNTPKVYLPLVARRR